MKIIRILALLISIMLIIAIISGCSDNKNYLIIIEKNGTNQYSFAKSITTNDEKSVKFIDENEREQFTTGDYITITKLKSKDQYLIIAKSNGMVDMIYPSKIISSDEKTAKYIDEKGKEQQVEGDITVIKIRETTKLLK